jgi:predicted site-specific integrase-resolvase
MLLKLPEAAQLCCISPATFKRWLAQGLIPDEAIFKPTKRCLRFRPEALQKWFCGELTAQDTVKRSPGRPKKQRQAS